METFTLLCKYSLKEVCIIVLALKLLDLRSMHQVKNSMSFTEI